MQAFLYAILLSNLKYRNCVFYFNSCLCVALYYYFGFRLYSLAWQLAPVQHSSGIETIETDLYRLHCFHTLTGIKLLVVADAKQQNVDAFLRKAYEIYADYALKNPFYLLDQPIRTDLFDLNLQLLADNIDRL